MIAEPVPVIEPLDDEVHETRLEIRGRSDRSIVAVIELLSPTNKVSNYKGRESFLQKRREILETTAHWIEIDLLRGGPRTNRHTAQNGSTYLAYLSRHEDARKGYAWLMPLREQLRVIGIPTPRRTSRCAAGSSASPRSGVPPRRIRS